MAHGWLSCESVEPGMFSDELLVAVKRANGKLAFEWVPKSKVREGTRQVSVEIGDAGDLVWATLPTPQPMTIAVRPSQVAP